MIGVAALAAMVHATFSLGLVGLAIRFFRISPVARSWMLAVAMILPTVMAGRSPAHPELAAQASVIARSSGLHRIHVRTVEGLGPPFAASGNRHRTLVGTSPSRGRRSRIASHGRWGTTVVAEHGSRWQASPCSAPLP